MNEPLANDDTCISIRIAAHPAIWTQNQGRTVSVAFLRLTLRIAHHWSLRRTKLEIELQKKEKKRKIVSSEMS